MFREQTLLSASKEQKERAMAGTLISLRKRANRQSGGYYLQGTQWTVKGSGFDCGEDYAPQHQASESIFDIRTPMTSYHGIANKVG